VASRLANHAMHEAHRLPPRPPRMRKSTYAEHVRRFRGYDALLDPTKRRQ
jgi:hypothetical protein